MSNEESKNDVVKEARELLDKISPWPWLYRNEEYDDWGVVRSSKPPENRSYCVIVAKAFAPTTESEKSEHRRKDTDPYFDNANFIARAPELLSTLCNEVERLQGERDGLDAAVTVQAESIETFQSQLRVMKEAIEATINFMRRWFGEHSSRKLPGDEELMALLESAITPKETEQKP